MKLVYLALLGSAAAIKLIKKQSLAQQADGPEDPQMTVPEVFAKLDANGDGIVTIDEFLKQGPIEEFDQYDRDADGQFDLNDAIEADAIVQAEQAERDA